MARKACRLLAEKSSSAARRMRPGRPSWTSAAPAIKSLPWPERPPALVGGSPWARPADRIPGLVNTWRCCIASTAAQAAGAAASGGLGW
jgi:hypothetical protein